MKPDPEDQELTAEGVAKIPTNKSQSPTVEPPVKQQWRLCPTQGGKT